MAAGQHIDYEALAQEAMRGVVRAVLEQVARTGLLGDHHFYIAFNTHAPGVSVSRRLKEKYPVEMTIVLQHRFWDLEVGDERFEVKLTFDGVPELLVVPFKAVKVFYDPSVPYGLQFEESELMSESGRRPPGRRRADQGDRNGARATSANEASAPVAATGRERPVRRPRADAKADAGGGDNERPKPAIVGRPTPVAVPVPSIAKAKPVAADARTEEHPPKAEAPKDAPKSEGGESKVVDFSKFRKK